MRLIVSLIAALLLAAPATAAAYSATDLAKAEPLARAVWPGSPCEGRENVVQTDDLRNGDQAGAEAEVGGSCVVRVRPSVDNPYTLCLILAHEFGHLAGYVGNDPDDPRHDVDDPRHPSIMAESDLVVMFPNGSYRPCAPLLAPLPKAEPYTVKSLAADTAHMPESKCHLRGLARRAGGSIRRYRCGARNVRVVNRRGIVSATIIKGA